MSTGKRLFTAYGNASITVRQIYPPLQPTKAMSQKEEWTKATFRLPKSLSRRIKHLAVDLDVSDTEVFNRALEKYLKEEEKKPKVS